MKTRGRPKSTNLEDRRHNTSKANVSDFVKESLARSIEPTKKETWNSFVKKNYRTHGR